MIASIFVYVFLALIVLGLLALLPMLLVNSKTDQVDKSMYKKNFDAEGKLKSYKADKADHEPDMKKKLSSFKIKD